MTPRWRVATSLLLPFATSACAPNVLVAAPVMPERAMPAIAIPDVAADSGLARVVITTDLPASVFTVSTVLTRRGPRTARTLVCSETPCVLTLPYGDHELELTALDVLERNSTVIAHVNASTVVLNHTLGRVHAPGGQAAGITLVVLGVLGLAVGLGAAASESKSSGTSTDGTTAAAVGLVGFGVIALGAALAAANPTVEQPGTTREWSPALARVAGGSCLAPVAPDSAIALWLRVAQPVAP